MPNAFLTRPARPERKKIINHGSTDYIEIHRGFVIKGPKDLNLNNLR